MKSFFQVAIVLVFLMFIFSLVMSFISSTGVFPYTDEIGDDVTSNEDFLSNFTNLGSSSMNAIFIGVTGFTFIMAVGLAFFTKSVVPIGLHLFGVVFWHSWIKTNVILGYGGYIPPELLIIFTVAVTFIFIAAIVGILTGSG